MEVVANTDVQCIVSYPLQCIVSYPLLLNLNPQGSHFGVVAHAGVVKEVPALDPTRITMLDAPDDTMMAFDVQVLFDGINLDELPVNVFVSAKRQAPKSGGISRELLSRNHELARKTIRDQAARQNFIPVFLYVSTASTNKLDETLERLGKKGQVDILVVSEDEMCTFLPVVASRPSLVALKGSKVLRQRAVSISNESA